jgi:hypothetical protein
MSSIHKTARLAGLTYFVFAVLGILSFVGAFGTFVVRDDGAATMQRIADHEFLYRLAILNDFITHVLFIVVVILLYELFRDVNRRAALLMVFFVIVPVAAQIANMVDDMVPLTLLRQSGVLGAFEPAQRNDLALATLRLHANAAALAIPFWGLWLFPFGALVIRSGYFPKLLGVLIIVAGAGYVMTGVTRILLPDQLDMVSKVAMPLYFGEVPIIFWMMIKGARTPEPDAALSRASAA